MLSKKVYNRHGRLQLESVSVVGLRALFTQHVGIIVNKLKFMKDGEIRASGKNHHNTVRILTWLDERIIDK